MPSRRGCNERLFGARTAARACAGRRGRGRAGGRASVRPGWRCAGAFFAAASPHPVGRPASGGALRRPGRRPAPPGVPSQVRGRLLRPPGWVSISCPARSWRWLAPAHASTRPPLSASEPPRAEPLAPPLSFLVVYDGVRVTSTADVDSAVVDWCGTLKLCVL